MQWATNSSTVKPPRHLDTLTYKRAFQFFRSPPFERSGGPRESGPIVRVVTTIPVRVLPANVAALGVIIHKLGEQTLSPDGAARDEAAMSLSVIPDPRIVPILVDGEGKPTGLKGLMAGLIGWCNATIFPDLGVPHPVAKLALFESFEHAEAAVEAFAAKGLKFVCAYHVEEHMDVAAVMKDMQGRLDAHAEQLSKIIETHFQAEAPPADAKAA